MPGNWAKPRAVIWRLRILDKQKLDFELPHELGNYNLHAHTTPLSAQKAECYVHKDLCSTSSARGERRPVQAAGRSRRPVRRGGWIPSGRRTRRASGLGKGRPTQARSRRDLARLAPSAAPIGGRPFCTLEAVRRRPVAPAAALALRCRPRAVLARPGHGRRSCILRLASSSDAAPVDFKDRLNNREAVGGVGGGLAGQLRKTTVCVSKGIRGAEAATAPLSDKQYVNVPNEECAA